MKKLFSPLLIILFILCSISLAQAQTVGEVLEKYITAVGGRAAWGKIEDLVMRGGIEMKGGGMQADIKLDLLKNVGELVEFSYGKETVTVLENTEGTWLKSGGKLTEISKEDESEASSDVEGELTDPYFPSFNKLAEGLIPELFSYQTDPTRFTLSPKRKKINKVRCYVITFTQADGTTTFYINKKNYLLVRTVSTLSIEKKGNEQTFKKTVDLKDYRTIKGVLLPFIQQINVQGTDYNFPPIEFRASAMNANLGDFVPEMFTPEFIE